VIGPGIPVNNCRWASASLVLKASSFKLDSWSLMCYCRIIKEKYMDNENLKRIADAIEEILRLVKLDQERMKKLNEEN
tara:strand:- start:149 stop:382 length:234 start_codon:yes stop_codon:yes gene_type:complete